VTLPVLITVTGLLRDKDGPVAGRIGFVRSQVLFPAAAADQNLLIPEEVVATIGDDGVLSVQLYASNDPNASPTGWTWEVRPFFPNWKSSFSVVVPYDAPSQTINLNQLAPVPPDGTGQLYALANHTHVGGGSVTYGPVTAETAYGASSNSGAADSVSRSDHRHGNPALPTPAAIGASATTHNHDASYQPLDSDLTTIAGLTPTSGNTVMAQGSAWASRTPAQVRVSLNVNALVLLGPLDPIPGGTPANSVIVRTT
jgi:hypothetical protein